MISKKGKKKKSEPVFGLILGGVIYYLNASLTARELNCFLGVIVEEWKVPPTYLL